MYNITIDESRLQVSPNWSVQDVRRLIVDRNVRFKDGIGLSDLECFKVLKVSVERHDRNEGVNYDVLEFWLFSLFRSRIINPRSKHGWYR